jgi:hypothetical protein
MICNSVVLPAPLRPGRAVVNVFVMLIVALVIDAEVERPPDMNFVEALGVVNRKVRAGAVFAQLVRLRDEDGNFGALRQIRQKLGVVIGDP